MHIININTPSLSPDGFNRAQKHHFTFFTTLPITKGQYMLLDLNQSISFLRALLGSYRIFGDVNLARSFDDVFKRTTEQFKLERDYLYSLILNEPSAIKTKTGTKTETKKRKSKTGGSYNG